MDIDTKLLNCQDDSPEIREELLRSKKIFEQQVEDLTRKIAWITIHIFSQVNYLTIILFKKDSKPYFSIGKTT